MSSTSDWKCRKYDWLTQGFAQNATVDGCQATAQELRSFLPSAAYLYLCQQKYFLNS